MSPEARDLITWSITTTIGICTLLGLLVKFVLMPYVRQHIVQPVKATREQVQNSHQTNLRDDLDVISRSVLRIETRLADGDARFDAIDDRLERGGL